MSLPLMDLIENQMIANRLPLVGISIAAVPHANTPVVLTLHWHGFVELRLADTGEANAVAYQSVPSSALQVNTRWDDLEDLDWDTLETAWELGAWNLERHEAKAFMRPGAANTETLQGRLAFGASEAPIDGNATILAEVPDADDLVEAAGRAGYVQWLFRPVRGGLWPDANDDITLESGGYRNPACPVISKQISTRVRPAVNRKVVYQFGRSARMR